MLDQCGVAYWSQDPSLMIALGHCPIAFLKPLSKKPEIWGEDCRGKKSGGEEL